MTVANPLLAHLENDLAPWQSCTVDASDMIAAAEQVPQLGLFEIRAGKLHHRAGLHQSWQFNRFLAIVRRLARFLPDTLLLVNALDEPRAYLPIPSETTVDRLHRHYGLPVGLYSSPPDKMSLPLFSACRIPGITRDLLFPFDRMIQTAFEPASTPDFPVDPGESRAVWRGSTTGHRLCSGSNHRRRFVELSRTCDKPALFDAGFSRILQAEDYRADWPEHFEALESMTLPWMEESAFGRYQVVVDIDGNSYSQRLAPLCRSHSALVRIGEAEDLLLRALRPDQDIVRIDCTLTNLVDTVEALISNPKARGEQVRNRHGRTFEVLTPQAIVTYVRALLQTYGEAVRFI